MNYLTEVSDTLRDVLKGMFDKGILLSSDEVRDYRLKLCDSCEHFYFNGQRRCKLCGCWMDYKVCLDSTKCKDGKW